MNSNVKKLTTAAILLAICIVSQFFKNFSVYITGPIINACLILAVIYCGLFWSVVLSIVTPITAFLITGAPVMKVVPAVMPLVMAGNAVLVIVFWLFVNKDKKLPKILVGGVLGSVAKGAFMALTISYGILTSVTLPEALQAKLPVLQTTYSVTQLLTALIGLAYAVVIHAALKKAMGSET